MGEGEGAIAIDGETIRRYENAHYGIAGRHSAVQICGWTRKSLRGQGVCYKQKFYGIDCHRCAQMSPAFAFCQECCVHCWRPAEWMKKIKMGERETDPPQLIIDKIVEKRKLLVCGIGGAGDADRKRFDESFKKFPSHWAISLSGEPTIYPKLGELIKLLRKNKEVRSIFLVTNGQEPQALAALKRRKALPTQLYVSISAPCEELFKKLNRSVYRDGWKRLQKTLAMLKTLGCRTVVRLTLIRGVNDFDAHLREYATMLETSGPDFIEVKSYMHLGLSRERLERDNMAPHDYVKAWTRKLVAVIPSYRTEDEDWASRIVLLKRKGSKFGNMIKNP
ncbi:4-demethylwyosine synthase TYW1 [Candidatus Micrarchaeota archaeon]|nr:4-demethylwyosine synthase TYW1 [Candidatus Micrarchaeota archaeon]